MMVHRQSAGVQNSPKIVQANGTLEQPTRPPSEAEPWRDFAAVPHEFTADPRLSDRAHRVLVALIYWAGSNAGCWASVENIRKRCGKKSDRSIQPALRELEALGYIRVEKDTKRHGNATGRVIVLLWREGKGGGPRKKLRGHPARSCTLTPQEVAGSPPEDPARSCTQGKSLSLKQKKTNRNGPDGRSISPQRQRSDGPPLPPVFRAPRSGPASNPLPKGSAKLHRSVIGACSPWPRQDPAPDAPKPASEALAKAVEHAKQVQSLNADPVVSGEPSEFAGPLPEVSLALLSEPEREKFNRCHPEIQKQLCEWLATGDPVLEREVKRRLRPIAPPPPPPQTMTELLERIRESPRYPVLAADLLAREFDDLKSRRGFEDRCRAAQEGRLEPAALVEAYRQATGPKAKNPGAIFMHAIKESR